MNLFALASLLLGISCLGLTAILLSHPKLRQQRIWAVFNIIVAIWGFGAFFAGISSSFFSAVVSWKFSYSGGIFISILFYHTVCHFCNLERKKSIIFAYVMGSIFLILNIFTPYFINQLEFVFGSFYYNKLTPLYCVWFVFWAAMACRAFYDLFKFIIENQGLKRTQGLYLFWATLLGFIGGTSTVLPTFGIKIYPALHFTICIYAILAMYAIFKYHLMNLKASITNVSIFGMIITFVLGVPIGLLFFNPYALAGLLLGITCFFLALISLIYAKRKVHYLMVCFNLACCFWGFGAFIVGLAKTQALAVFGWKVAYLGGLFIGYGFYHMVCVFCELKRKWTLRIIYAQGIFWWYLNCCTDLFVSNMRIAFGQLYYHTANIFFTTFLIIWVGVVIMSFLELYRYCKREKAIKRTQALYMFFGFLTGFIGGVSTLMPIFGIDIFYPAGNITIVVYCLIVTFAMLRYQLMDIDMVITRTAIFVGVYTVFIGIPFAVAYWGRFYFIEVLHENWYMLPLGLMAILAAASPMAYMTLQRRAERRLLREERMVHEKLHMIVSDDLIKVRNLNEVMKATIPRIGEIMNASGIMLFLNEFGTEKYDMRISRFTHKHPHLNEVEKAEIINIIASQLKKKRKYIYSKDITDDMMQNSRELSQLISALEKINAMIVIPSFVEDTLLCFLVLAEREENKPYSQKDIDELCMISNQLGLALENAIFYEETGKDIAQRQHEARLKSLGVLASAIGHQINNRMNAILSAEQFVEFLYENLKPNFSTASQQELLDFIAQVMDALFNIRDDAQRTSSIAETLRKFATKEEKNVEPIDPRKIISGVESLLSCKRTKNEMQSFYVDYPDVAPPVRGNLPQLQDIMFNLIDNAFDAVQDKYLESKKPKDEQRFHVPKNYKGEVQVNWILKNKNWWKIQVKDNGIGMTREVADKLYVPLFTTKGADKGTGLGMGVIKSIVSAHKGTVELVSEFGKGTTFTIELPVYSEKTEKKFA